MIGMRYLVLLAFFILPFTAVAQNPKFNLAEREMAIRKIIASNPDSARVLIKQVLNYKGKLHDTIYANANIFYGYTYLLKNNPDSSIYYYNRALTYSDDYPAHYARALRNKAAAYRKKSDYAQSLKLLDIAEEKYKALNDPKGLATVYGEVASNYNLMLKSQEAIPYLLKAIALLEKQNDTFSILPIKQSLANTYMNIGNFEFAIELYKEVLNGFKANNLMKNYYLTLVNYGDCYIYLQKNAPAKKAILEAIAGLEKFNDTELIALAYSKLGRMEEAEKNHIQAAAYYKKAYKLAAANNNSTRVVIIASGYLTTLNNQKRYTEALAIIDSVEKHPSLEKTNLQDKMAYEQIKTVIYQNSHKDDMVLATLKKTIKIYDTLNKADQKEAIIKMQGEYQNKYQDKKTNKLKKINTALKEKVADTRKRRILQIGSLVAILLLIIGLYVYKSRRHKQKIVLAQTDTRLLMQQYESKKEINKKLKSGIKEKQGELVSNVFVMNNVQENINKMIDLYNNNSRTSQAPDVESIKKNLEELISDNDYWTLFRKSFSYSYADFEEKLSLKFPQLSKKELFFCSLLKLNLPYKDLAVILQVSPESVRKKKYRIKKKMEIESEHDLEHLINSL
jgi:tetratricopeptide (TPR) repeat protein